MELDLGGPGRSGGQRGHVAQLEARSRNPPPSRPHPGRLTCAAMVKQHRRPRGAGKGNAAPSARPLSVLNHDFGAAAELFMGY